MNMNTDGSARTWRVTLVDGRSVEVSGRKIVVTDSGALMVLGDGGEPSHIFASWAECIAEAGHRRVAS
jgi:hypothetical protein